MSRTLVGEEPKELPARAMSLLVFREEPKLFAGTVLSNKGNSFQLISLPFQLDNDAQFVDSQVGIRTPKLHKYNFVVNISPLFMFLNALLYLLVKVYKFGLLGDFSYGLVLLYKAHFLSLLRDHGDSSERTVHRLSCSIGQIHQICTFFLRYKLYCFS